MHACMHVACCHSDAMHDARDVRFVSGGSQKFNTFSGMKYEVIKLIFVTL